MRLEYRILWFEDNESWFDTLRELLKDYLDSNGFELATNRRSDGDELASIINKSDYDLILMDYNLAGVSGDLLIEGIRNHQLYTEIVFYSQNGAQAIREIIKDKGVDGVYCTSRDTFEFEDKVTKVIQTTIKKVQDVNNMRGLVMAETSELDNKMLNIILSFISNANQEAKEKLENIVFKMVGDSIKGNSNKFERLKQESKGKLEELICSSLFDADKKRRTVNNLLEILNDVSLNDIVSCMDEYKVEVLDIRNVLAHVRADEDNGKKVLRPLLKGYEAIKIDDEMCTKIRKDIKKHSQNLDRILNYLRNRHDIEPQAM